MGTRRIRGQTLVITLLIMFVMVILGFVVMVVLSRQISSTGAARQRNIANELSQAGVRYCFAQLRFSEDGADWRPQPPGTIATPGLDPSFDPENPNATNPDPDYFWLRAGDPNVPGDQGGSDGLGPFTRLNYDGGRALVRVRYAPSGEEIFSQNGGQLVINQRGQLRAYTLIESVGRPGAFNSLDPTAVREPDLQRARQLTAVATIGVIESARYITNKDNRNQPADIGTPHEFGSNYLGNAVHVRSFMGGALSRLPNGATITLGGPMYVNAPLRVFGDLTAQNSPSGLFLTLNADLGDQLNIAGELTFAESSSALRVFRVSGSTVSPFDASPSASPNFTTGGGVLRDIYDLPDAQGYARSSPVKEPPLVDELDPNSEQLRYRSATRDSGALGSAGFNLGRLGYGRGVYINNSEDLNRDSEDGNYTQRFDWMNPNAHPQGYWQGPYYLPPAVYIQLMPDGFIIRRNIKNNRDTWRSYTGADTGRHTLRFKVGLGTSGDVRIINELTPGVVNFSNPSQGDFDQGVPFSGVIFCEGNVRVRGVIQAGLQLTIVSMGSGYVEGSVVKSDATSTLALLCRDNVVLNTSQFIASSPDNTLQVVRDNQNPTSPARIRVDTSHPFDALLQFPTNPATGNSFLSEYTWNHPNRNGGNPPVRPSLFVAQAAEFDRSTFINLLINQGQSPAPEFLFENQNPPNAASPFFPPGNPIPAYGLADPAQQVLPVFEKRRFEFFSIVGNVNGSYTVYDGGVENPFHFKLDNTINTTGRGDYFFSRITAQPTDVRIEAALYAQEGSFFVIPGVWFNHNPNDRRDSFVNAADRKAAYQADVEYPFYAEPVDVKVTIIGSVSENFPPPMADQTSWLQKWGWIPAEYGESQQFIPDQHFPVIPGTQNPDYVDTYVPNLFINYDPTLISGRVGGSFDVNNAPPIRSDLYGRPLPPMPKLPVGTKLFYFGEVNP